MFLLGWLLFYQQIKVKIRYDQSHDLSFQLELVIGHQDANQITCFKRIDLVLLICMNSFQLHQTLQQILQLCLSWIHLTQLQALW